MRTQKFTIIAAIILCLALCGCQCNSTPKSETENIATIETIELAYNTSFGVCGTGLSSETSAIAGASVSIGTYDDHEYWDFISFHGESEISALGLYFSLKNISPSGATLVFNQYNSDAPTGELECGEDFTLEVLDNGKWESVPIALEGNYAFNAVAYIIAAGQSTEMELNWEWLYGKLPAGEYRVGKVIHDFRETGDFDKYAVYAHFFLT